MKPQLILTRGAPASGKTTYAEGMVRTHGFVNLNRDDLRASMFPHFYTNGRYKPNRQREDAVTRAQYTMARDFISANQSVIISDTNLREDTVTRYRNLAAGWNANFQIKDFYVDLDELLERNAKRDNGVPPKVVHDMYYRHVEIAFPHWKVEHDPSLPSVIIVDVDGTLANHEGVRSPYDASKVHLDRPHTDIIDLVRDLGYDIIVMTGRDASAKKATGEWLYRHGVPFDKLLIRAEGDTRKDSVIKRELFDEHVRGKYNVKYVIDDRLQVIYMWRALGLRVLDVAGGAF